MTSFAPSIAWRYLRGKRKNNLAPLLSKVSITALAIGAAALITLLSVSNGFNDLISGLFNVFYPEVKISAQQGKFFTLPVEDQFNKIKAIQGVEDVSFIIEDKVLVEGNDEQIVATLKGVSNNYFKVHPLEQYIEYGIDSVVSYPLPTALVGLTIASNLGIDVNNIFSRLQVFYPNSEKDIAAIAQNPEQAFNQLDLKPDGIFKVQQDFDATLILAPYHKVATLFGKEGKVSSIELALQKNAKISDVKQAVKSILGEQYLVQERHEQNKSLYQIMNSEKFVLYLILVLVLIIASFNMVGALLLLVIEKSKDLKIIYAIGASKQQLQSIVLWQGLLWSLMSTVIGLALGLLVCGLQQYFGIVKMGSDFVVEDYPVAVQFTDVLLVAATVIGVGLGASLFPSWRARKIVDYRD